MDGWGTGAELLERRLATAQAFHGRVRGPSLRMAAATGTGEPAIPPLPDYVISFLAKLRLLIGVPFAHIVPNADLLPSESIRFFYLNRNWTDALIEGALAVGSSGTRDQAQLVTLLDLVHAELDLVESTVRNQQRGRINATQARQIARESASVDTLTGFLLRSAVVAGWPAMTVRAYAGTIPPGADPDTSSSAQKLPTMRLERLAPSVLFALFGGVPSLIMVEEPHHSVQLGFVRKDSSAHPTAVPGDFQVELRLANGKLADEQVPVPFRSGAADLGVVDVATLVQRLAKAAPQHPGMPTEIGPAALALELLQPPWRQRFDSNVP